MDYFKILNLTREPFSNSPEPDFFYQSVQHHQCLQQLELAIRLKRGLSIVIGEVGTGKTTLCRQLILKLSENDEANDKINTYLLMDPAFATPLEFLIRVSESFGLDVSKAANSEWQIKEAIKHYLFERSIGGKETVVLIIDEGQKLPAYCLEILREFLNYETNEFKLLQIVIFAQKEFQHTVQEHPNFKDRVNRFHYLNPLSFSETKAMIAFRMGKACGQTRTAELFSWPCYWGIYLYSGGYPRKIVTLCHQIILALIIQNRAKAGFLLTRSCAKRASGETFLRHDYRYAVITLTVIALVISGFWIYGGHDGNNAFPLYKANRAIAAEEVTAGSPVQEKPVTLGVLKIDRGYTVYRILQEIYGNYDEELVQEFKRHNLQIQDINMVQQGSAVVIPAVSAKDDPELRKGCWVRLSAKSTLNDALAFIRDYPAGLPSVRLIPYWNKQEGLVFAVIMTNRFKDSEAALSTIQSLSSPHLRASRVMNHWGDETEFYIR